MHKHGQIESLLVSMENSFDSLDFTITDFDRVKISGQSKGSMKYEENIVLDHNYSVPIIRFKSFI